MNWFAKEGEQQGLLLVGHGTRCSQGRAEFLSTAKLVAQLAPACLVEPCFLELANPSVELGVSKLAERGARRLTVVPVLLFSAGHAKEDIPRAVRQAIAATRFETFAYASPLGCHPWLLEASRRRHQLAVAPQAAVSSERTLLLLVGRGSSDEQATLEMHRFAQLRATPQLARHTRVAFLAKARPGLEEVLLGLTTTDVDRVVVQPHLLFFGELLISLRERIEQMAGCRPYQEWLICGHLGPSNLLAQAILDCCQQSV